MASEAETHPEPAPDACRSVYALPAGSTFTMLRIALIDDRTTWDGKHGRIFGTNSGLLTVYRDRSSASCQPDNSRVADAKRLRSAVRAYVRVESLACAILHRGPSFRYGCDGRQGLTVARRGFDRGLGT